MNQWKSCWSYCQFDNEANAYEIEDETQRVLIRCNGSGKALRIRLSNTYKEKGEDAPLRIAGASIGRWRTGKTEALDRLYFDGQEDCLVPAGTDCYSDALSYPVSCGEILVVSLYVKERTRIRSVINYVSTGMTRVMNSVSGDQTMEKDFTVRPQDSYIPNVMGDPGNHIIYGVTSVELFSDKNALTIAAFGDSITNMSAWTNGWMKELLDTGTRDISIVNRGISGNRILRDTSPAMARGEMFGIAGLHRFQRDVCQEGGIDAVVIWQGVNDLMHPYDGAGFHEVVTIQEVTNGLRSMVEQAHESGIFAIGGTIAPYMSYNLPKKAWAEEADLLRNEINKWIRSSGTYDYVLDFDALLQDREDSRKLAARYDFGDHLHLSEEAGKCIGKYVNQQELYGMIRIDRDRIRGE